MAISDSTKPSTDGRRLALRVQEVVLPALLLAATAAAAYGLYEAQRNALPLRILHPRVFPVFRVGLFAAVVASPAALLAWAARRRRAPLRTLAPLRVFFYALTLGHVGFVAVVENFERIYFDLALGLVCGAFGGLVLAGLFLPRRTKLLRVLDFLLFQVCALIVLFELLLRVLAAVAPSPLLTIGDTGPQKYIEVYQLEPKSLRYNFRVNSVGHYDEEFTKKRVGETLVVSIGDSFSVGIVPYDHLYTTLAERAVEGLRIHNFGVVACGPREYLFMLRQHGLVYKPDAILINLYVGNDFLIREDENADNLFLRGICDRKSLLSWVVPARFATILQEVRGRGDEPLVTDEDATARIHHPPHIDDVSLEVPTYTPTAFMRIEIERATQVCAEGPYPSPRFFAYLEQILAAAGDTPVFFSIIPDEFQVEDALWEKVTAGASVPLDRDRPQRLLAEWFEARDIPFVDFLPAMRAVPTLEDGDRHLFHLRDTHINARGNAVAGEALAGFLREQLGG